MKGYEIIISCLECSKQTPSRIFREEKPKSGEKIKCPEGHENAIIYAVIINGRKVDCIDDI